MSRQPSPPTSRATAVPVDRIAEGVYRLGTSWVGWYLVVDETVTIVDCGFPGYHDQLPVALAQLGHSLDSVAAVVLTHYHPDHVGSAERIRIETGAKVYVPKEDAEGARTGKVPLPAGMISSTWRPRMLRYMLHAGRNGAGGNHAVSDFSTYGDGDLVAGGLRAIHTPGHTAGHSSLLAEHLGVLFAGDALAALSFFDPSARGPQLVPFNEDAGRALDSLSRLEPLSARVVAFGHGQPFRGKPADAVKAARGA